MDGIAVRAARYGGSQPRRRPCGSAPDAFEVVDTGDPCPDGYDAVVMREHVHERGDGAVELRTAAPPTSTCARSAKT